ncbi:MAG: hypothetical protein K2J82_06710, partial [Muribaculaceae bacterium]|nr:hypothetical protein [Muribaculaceae bacterium]
NLPGRQNGNFLYGEGEITLLLRGKLGTTSLPGLFSLTTRKENYHFTPPGSWGQLPSPGV